MHLWDDETLKGVAVESEGGNSDSGDKILKHKQGDNVDGPGKEAKGDQIDREKQELDDRLNDFVQQSPYHGGGEIGNQLIGNSQAGEEQGDEIKSNQIKKDGAQNGFH